MSPSRLWARKDRFAHASCEVPSNWAASVRLSGSKCLSARAFLSMGSSRFGASRTLSIRSARRAAWLGKVCGPRSIDASAAELTSGGER
jgi:hypothetical protein